MQATSSQVQPRRRGASHAIPTEHCHKSTWTTAKCPRLLSRMHIRTVDCLCRILGSSFHGPSHEFPHRRLSHSLISVPVAHSCATRWLRLCTAGLGHAQTFAQAMSRQRKPTSLLSSRQRVKTIFCERTCAGPCFGCGLRREITKW